MSYDIYCYRSKRGTPDENEANEVCEADSDKWIKKDSDPAGKLAIVKALKAHNPAIEVFDFNYGDISQLPPAIIDKEKNKFDYIEINHPDGDVSLQIIVYDNHVFLTVPYWYQGQQAQRLFEYIKAYVDTIRATAGYFVFDPQTGKAFDPAETEFNGIEKYLSVSEHVDEMINQKNTELPRATRPWWKIW